MLTHCEIPCGHVSTVVDFLSLWQTAPTSIGIRVIRCIGRVRNDDKGNS